MLSSKMGWAVSGFWTCCVTSIFNQYFLQYDIAYSKYGDVNIDHFVYEEIPYSPSKIVLFPYSPSKFTLPLSTITLN